MERRALDQEQDSGNTKVKGVSLGRRNPKEMEKEGEYQERAGVMEAETDN